MITNNESKNLSRNRKRRIERKLKMDDKTKILLNKIEAERKKKNKIFGRTKHLEFQLVKIKNVNNPNLLESKLKRLNKIQVVDEKLHEFKNEILRGYGGEYKLFGKLTVGDQIRETHIRFRNTPHYEPYKNAIDEEYDADDAIFNGHTYKIETPDFNVVSRSRYGNGCDFKHQIIEYKGNNFYIPSEGYCFSKCIIYLTESDYKGQISILLEMNKDGQIL